MTDYPCVIQKDGRTGWPSIFVYEYDGGAQVAVPPMDGTSFKLVIHDREGFEALSRTGMLMLEAHTGKRVILHDHRKTTR